MLNLQIISLQRSRTTLHTILLRMTLPFPDLMITYTQPVGLGRPANLHACLPGP